MKHNETYTPEVIASRLEEAARTMKRLPAVKIQGYASIWPDIVYSEMEKLQMELTSEKWFATPEEITRMEQACKWLGFIDNVNDRKLLWLRAERVRWKLICAKLGIARATANRRWTKALLIISRKLSQTLANTMRQKNVRQKKQDSL